MLELAATADAEALFDTDRNRTRQGTMLSVRPNLPGSTLAGFRPWSSWAEPSAWSGRRERALRYASPRVSRERGQNHDCGGRADCRRSAAQEDEDVGTVAHKLDEGRQP